MQLDTIADDCSVPRDALQIEGDKLLIFPNEDIMKTGRLLMALQATDETSLSGVGNQMHKTPDRP